MSEDNQPPAKKPSAASTNDATRAARRSKAKLLVAVRGLMDEHTVPSVIASRLKLTKEQVTRYMEQIDRLRGGRDSLAHEQSPIGDTERANDVSANGNGKQPATAKIIRWRDKARGIREDDPPASSPSEFNHPVWCNHAQVQVTDWMRERLIDLDSRIDELEEARRLSPLNESQMRAVLDLAAKVAREAASNYQIYVGA